EARRVVSGLRGTLKSEGLEAPFVGRARELRQIKDLFHACAEERKAHLISVTGIAGIGKSRLAWEFYKYFDGIAETVYWHRGRCLPYGEGVTYWALADMVRMRCRISEGEQPATAVEYLLDWSRNHGLFVVTLARPELLERRPTWGAGQRSFTSMYLEPLSEAAMEELLTGLVPGLPESLRTQILARAEGVPLYAVETVRMLLDRGLLVQDGPVYTPTGEIETLEVPETLHALIAARLDGLSGEERRLLQDGA